MRGEGGSYSEREWNYEEGVAGQRLASREDRWTEDNYGECPGRREHSKGVQKGQVAEATPPTAAGAAPELSIMRAPAAPSLPPSLSPSPPRLEQPPCR